MFEIVVVLIVLILWIYVKKDKREGMCIISTEQYDIENELVAKAPFLVSEEMKRGRGAVYSVSNGDKKLYAHLDISREGINIVEPFQRSLSHRWFITFLFGPAHHFRNDKVEECGEKFEGEETKERAEDMSKKYTDEFRGKWESWVVNGTWKVECETPDYRFDASSLPVGTVMSGCEHRMISKNKKYMFIVHHVRGPELYKVEDLEQKGVGQRREGKDEKTERLYSSMIDKLYDMEKNGHSSIPGEHWTWFNCKYRFDNKENDPRNFGEFGNPIWPKQEGDNTFKEAEEKFERYVGRVTQEGFSIDVIDKFPANPETVPNTRREMILSKNGIGEMRLMTLTNQGKLKFT